jgi:hypothetical protein
VDEKRRPVHVYSVGVVRAEVLLLTVSSGGGVEHVDVAELAVVAAELQDVVWVLGEGGPRDRAKDHVREVDRVWPEQRVLQVRVLLPACLPEEQPLAIHRAATRDRDVLQRVGLGLSTRHDEGRPQRAVSPGLKVVRAQQRRPLLDVQLLVRRGEVDREDEEGPRRGDHDRATPTFLAAVVKRRLDMPGVIALAVPLRPKVGDDALRRRDRPYIDVAAADDAASRGGGHDGGGGGAAEQQQQEHPAKSSSIMGRGCCTQGVHRREGRERRPAAAAAVAFGAQSARPARPAAAAAARGGRAARWGSAAAAGAIEAVWPLAGWRSRAINSSCLKYTAN